MLGRAERPGRYDVGPEREDPDEKAAFLVARGYAPGTIYQLQQQLGDVEAAAQGEREKIGKAAKRAESIHRAHQAGRLDVFAAARALDEGDAGDEGKVRLLERRAESLRAQIADVTEAISPPERQAPGPVEAAAQRAQQIAAAVAEEWRLKDAADARALTQLRAERASFRRSHRPFADGGAGDGSERTGYAYR